MTRSQQLHVAAVAAVCEFYANRGYAHVPTIKVRVDRVETYEQFGDLVVGCAVEIAERLPDDLVALIKRKPRPTMADLMGALED